MAYTIYDLAKDADVSVTTVSRVINNSGLVKKETRQRILQLMKEKKYSPNAFARGLNNISLKTVGVVICDIANPFFAEVVKGIDAVCRRNEYNLILCSTENNPDTEKKEISMLLHKKIEGLIIVGSRPTKDPNADFLIKISKSIPIVLINSSIKGGHMMYSVIVDEQEATYDACTHLIEKGYKKIFLLGDPSWKTTLKKLSALKKCLADHGLPYESNQFIGSYYSYTSGKAAVEEILQSGAPYPYALFCCADMIALGAMRELQTNNIKIPEEVGVVGYSNTQVSALTTPSLTTVDQKMYDLGEKAATVFLNLLDETYPATKKTYCSFELLLRESTL